MILGDSISEEKARKQSHLKLIKQNKQKNQIPKNKFNLGGERPILWKQQDTDEKNRKQYKQMEKYVMLMDLKN